MYMYVEACAILSKIFAGHHFGEFREWLRMRGILSANFP